MNLMRHVMARSLLWSIVLLMARPGEVFAAPDILLKKLPLHLASCTSGAGDKLIATTATISSPLHTGERAHLYQAGFRTSTGSGSLRKILLAEQAEEKAFVWDAGDLLATRTTDRRIFTASQNGDHFAGISFLWHALSAVQQQALDRSPVTLEDDQLGEKRLRYVRGERLHEVDIDGIFPKRDRLLGAIVHGVAAFAGAPSTTTFGRDYYRYYETHRLRRPAVYVGAGDGMLHAFDARTGEELFAYVPHAVFVNLTRLTVAQGWGSLPLDGGIAIADVRADDRWRTVLVAGMGRAAQGLFALDVTEPDKFDGENVLWEFTDADDADMGNVIGTPVIARFRTGFVKGVAHYRYFVVVASGVNNHRDDGEGRFNPAAPNVLFLVALDRKKSESWRIGTNYFKFVLSAGDRQLANGMSDVAVVPAGDGTASHAYAGDMQGNLWRFDFSGNAPWPDALGTASPRPLFVARDAGGRRQPITQKPGVAFAPGDGYLVLFGTGRYLERADLDRKSYETQSFYALLDDDGERISGRKALMPRRLQSVQNDAVLEISGDAFGFGMPGPGEQGWYVDFIDSDTTGERSISPVSIVDTSLLFHTLLPSEGACEQPHGRSYVLNTVTGLSASAHLTGYLSETFFPDIPPLSSMTPFDADVTDGTVERDATGKRRITRKIQTVSPAEDGSPPAVKTIVETVTTAGRLSWREIVNWLELRNDR